MRNRTLVYMLAGALAIGMQLAGVYVIVRQQRSPEQPVLLPTPMLLPTPPPIPVVFQPWTRPVVTDYACLYFSGTQVDMRTGASTAVGEPAQSSYTWMSGRTQSPDGRHEIYQNEQRLFVRFSSAEPVQVADALQYPAWLSVRWSADNRYVAVPEADRLRIFDTASGDAAASLNLNPQAAPLLFLEWSSDSAYLAFADYQNLQVWSAADGRRYDVPQPPDSVLQNQFAWSPGENRLAYTWATSGSLQAFVSMYTPGGERQPRFPLPVSWIDRMDWSLDGRWLAVQQAFDGDYEHTALHLFGVDGTARPNALVFRRTYDMSSGLLKDQVMWLPDSRSLLVYESYWVQEEDDFAYQFVQYDLASQLTQVIGQHLPQPPAYAPGGAHTALLDRRDSRTMIDVLAFPDGTRRGFIEGADDAGSPTWSPDGRYVAAVWATGVGGGRKVYLSWMRADGSDKHTLDDEFWDVHDLRWLADGETLAYIAQRREGYSLEVADLNTGDTKMLLRSRTKVGELVYEGDWLELNWQTALYKGRSIYAVGNEGQTAPRYVLQLSPDTDLDDRITVFLAPGGQVAAIKTGPYYDESLQLASADLSWSRVVRSGLYGLGDPLWSPDGTMVAFTQAARWGESSLDVVSAAGEDVWNTAAYPSAYWNLAWQWCA